MNKSIDETNLNFLLSRYEIKRPNGYPSDRTGNGTCLAVSITKKQTLKIKKKKKKKRNDAKNN
jgi:hypothetical protein